MPSKKAVPLTQERRQLPDDLIAKIVRESRKESSDRVAVGWRPLAERYVQMRCALRVWIRLRTSALESTISVFRCIGPCTRKVALEVMA